MQPAPPPPQVHNWYCFFAVAGGLWAGLAIGYVTEFYTSHAYRPVREVARAERNPHE